jgi:hypothetical protein
LMFLRSARGDTTMMQATWSRYLFSTTVLAYGTDTHLDPTSPLASHSLLKGTGIYVQ